MDTVPQNLSDFILAEVARQGSEENVRKIVEENIEKTIARAVTSAMASYGSVGKQIEKAVEQSLELGDRLDVPSYNAMVLAVLRRKMDEVLSSIVNDHLTKEITEILGVGAREVKLEAIITDMKGEIDESNFHNRCTVIIEEAYPDSATLKGYRRIYLDPNDITKRSASSYTSYLARDPKKGAEVVLTLQRDGTISDLSVEGKDAKTTVGIGPMFGWQKTLFALFATGGKLIVEHESDDYYDKNYGDY